MADDAQTTIQLATLSGIQPFYATRDGSGNYTLQSTPRVMGAQVDVNNPMPVQAPPALTVCSAELENSHALKLTPGTLFSLQANAIISGYVMLFDADEAPNDGAVTPRKVWFYSNATQETIDKTFDPPLAMQVGAVVVFSTTGPLQKTTPGTPSAQFSAEIQ